MSRIPQSTRSRHPPPTSPTANIGTQTRKSFLSPKIIWSPSPTSNRIIPSVAKYQLQDPGVVPGSMKVVKRPMIRPPTTYGYITDKAKRGIAPSNPNSFDKRDSSDISSPASNLAVVNHEAGRLVPFKPPSTPSRPASQTTRSSILNTGIKQSEMTPNSQRPRPSPSRINLPSSSNPSAQSQFRSSIPIPKPKIPTVSNYRQCHSPAISICATVAPVSPPLLVSQPINLERNVSAHESIYSSASAMALARYRSVDSTDMMDIKIEQTPTQGYDLSRISSTTSYSSASSLARHRLSRGNPPTLAQEADREATPMSGTTSMSSSSQGVALIWHPDPEAGCYDPAENLWMEIEARLNRRSFRERDERGQWILTTCNRQKARSPIPTQEDIQVPISSSSSKMEKEESEFTISAYFDPDLSAPLIRSSSSSVSSFSTERSNGELDGTAIFDMSAPLVISTSRVEETMMGVGKTPANTPLIRHETIQRVSRVRKFTSTSGVGSVGMVNVPGSKSRLRRTRMSTSSNGGSTMGRSRSDSSSAVVDLDLDLDHSSNTQTSQKKRDEQESIHDSHSPASGGSYTYTNQLDLRSRRDSFQSYEGVSKETRVGEKMIRLDSHVQAALEELSDLHYTFPESESEMTTTPLAEIANINNHNLTQIEAQAEDHHAAPMDCTVRDKDEVSEVEVAESTPVPIINSYLYRAPSIPTSLDSPEIGSTQNGTRDHTNPNDGLGMGIDLQLDSIYSLPVISRSNVTQPYSDDSNRKDLRWGTSSSMTTSRSSNTNSENSPTLSNSSDLDKDRKQVQDGLISSDGGNQFVSPRLGKAEVNLEEEEEEDEMLIVTDLDTGHRVDLSIKRLDELWLL